jgi:uncharacterized membrane protein YcaP (DUF421 family)
MELDWIWMSFLIVLVGTIILRMAGRKSIAQMTVSQTIIMIAIGSLLIQPFNQKDIWTTLAISLLFILILIVMEYSQVKLNFMERLLSGTAKIVIKDGEIIESTLRKLRLPIDQLEKQLRQESITKIEDVKYATIEPSGQLGYELYDHAKPATKQDIDKLMAELQNMMYQLNLSIKEKEVPTPTFNIFDEVHYKTHKNQPPEHLQ